MTPKRSFLQQTIPRAHARDPVLTVASTVRRFFAAKLRNSTKQLLYAGIPHTKAAFREFIKVARPVSESFLMLGGL
jgi:hypothetical protein